MSFVILLAFIALFLCCVMDAARALEERKYGSVVGMTLLAAFIVLFITITY